MRRLDASLGGLITPCSYMLGPHHMVPSCLGLTDDFLILTSLRAQKKYLICGGYLLQKILSLGEPGRRAERDVTTLSSAAKRLQIRSKTGLDSSKREWGSYEKPFPKLQYCKPRSFLLYLWTLWSTSPRFPHSLPSCIFPYVPQFAEIIEFVIWSKRAYERRLLNFILLTSKNSEKGVY